MSAIAVNGNVVQHILSKLPGPFFGRWDMQAHPFIRARLVNRTWRDASLRVVAWWYEWLRMFGNKHHGKAVFLKTVPLYMQVWRLGAKRAERRWRQWYLRITIEERNALERWRYAKRQLDEATAGYDRQREMFKALNDAYNARKRKRIDISALVE